jgi:dipeptide/tripeptide permease
LNLAQDIKITSDVVGSEAPLQDTPKPKLCEKAVLKRRETDKADLKNEPTSQLAHVDTGADDLVQIPTDEERRSLRKVAGTVPWIAYALCVVELAERASYYGATQVFMNFLQRPLPKDGNGAGAPPAGTEVTPGALGQGLQVANAVLLLFKFLAYTLPTFGAWLADSKIGRYKAIVLGVIICGVAHVVQVVGALPVVLQREEGLAPFLLSIFLLAIGAGELLPSHGRSMVELTTAGIFKPNILPIVLDQHRSQQAFVSTLKSGERVVVDPEATIDRITLIFYAFINIGGFFPMASVFAEKKVGFWLAFLLPGIIYFLLPIGLLATYKKTHRVPPNGSAVNNFFRIVMVALSRSKGRFWKHGFWNAAKPSVLAAAGIMSWKEQAINWTDATVDDVRRTLSACKIFRYFPIYYLNSAGIGAIATSQGATMTTDGVPNDLMVNFNPLTIIVFAPFLTHVLYPMLRTVNRMPKPVTRITFGFTLACASSVCGAVTQWYIYTTSPCGYYATECERGCTVSPMPIWWQL